MKERRGEGSGNCFLPRLAAFLLFIAAGCANASPEPTQATLATTTTATTLAAPTEVGSNLEELEEGLPRSSSYSFLDVSLERATLANIDPRSYLTGDHVAGADRYLFLSLSVVNTSNTDTANWPINPFALAIGTDLVPADVLEGRPHIGLPPLQDTEMIVAFPVPAGVTFDDVALVLAEEDRIPMLLPLTGEVPTDPYPYVVELSGEGVAQGLGVGCRQSLYVTALEGWLSIDLLDSDYPTSYGSRRAMIGDRFLTVSLHVLNNGGYRCGGGASNFGNQDVRLVVDGSPSEPVTWVNAALGLNAAEEFEFSFTYPVEADSV
ncbi:MAG: hypothetical protein OEM32_01865, partial [Acidimicrobiia bacterium]|nr:hypothetical protein [Acidimicrobiia bacterium]